MDVLDLRIRCEAKMKELLDRHFGDLVKEAVADRPEVLEERFTPELPLKIEEEYMAFLGELKQEILPGDSRTIEEIIDCPLRREMIRDDYELDVERAYEDAATVTFWEKLTRSNYKALETTAVTLNRVPSKSVQKTPHEMWTGKCPNMSFMKI